MGYIIGRASAGFALDGIVERLREEYPEIAAISDDYRATRLARQKTIARELGMPDDCAPIQCTERVSQEHGLQLHLSIPISVGLTVDARIDKTGVLIVGESQISHRQPYCG
jgi:hypothetical protein